MREADIAMYEAKAQGRNGVIVFNQDLAQRVERHLLIEQRLHYALKENKIDVFYQPQFDKDEKIVGCESLIRWEDDELGVVDPEEFIPIVENTGLILEVGSYVLKETFESVNRWNREGKILDSISVNVSMRQLLCDTFVDEVENLMKIYLPYKENEQKIYFRINSNCGNDCWNDKY